MNSKQFFCIVKILVVYPFLRSKPQNPVYYKIHKIPCIFKLYNTYTPYHVLNYKEMIQHDILPLIRAKMKNVI